VLRERARELEQGAAAAYQQLHEAVKARHVADEQVCSLRPHALVAQGLRLSKGS
jgi:hypothetical protein